MDRKFNLVKKGNTEALINFKLNNPFDEIPIDKFIRQYKISNFFKGSFFIKRLINKIFKYKINKQVIWTSNFWETVSVLKYKASITHNSNDLISFIEEVNKNYSNRRIKKIYSLKKIIKDNNNIEYPLFISGDCLNLINANVSNDSIYMLDGSRRIIAYLLNDISNINVYLLVKK